MGARFSAPFETGSDAHPASHTMGTVSFPGVKRPGRDAIDPLRSSAEVKDTVELQIYSHIVTSWKVYGEHDVHESVHRNTTMKITNKMHYID